ncbi:unnamed protein product [Cladocopium goreaui]|uniref:Uncharacterized protein n=1 Tax=Cladocopium goreaui TaxID=2562237 RepID=A0A9P1FQY6_9DINO|nr:unnamed protein product [Cladocopium goreaui]
MTTYFVGVLQDFVLCILLIYWTYAVWEQYDYYEFFAGIGNLTKQARACGYKALRFDILDNVKPKDRKSNFMDLNSASGFALAVVCLLRARCGDFSAHFAMKCASFCKMNVGTSKRSPCSSTGFTDYPSVSQSNMLGERTCLLILLCTALGGVWTVEQPQGSVYEFLPAFRAMLRSIFASGGIRAVVKVSWWMQHYQGPTPKRHYAYSNSRDVLSLDKGKLKKHQRKPKEERIRTADVYKDRKGKLRYKGNANLRPTQIYPMPFARHLIDRLETMKATAHGAPVLPSEVPDAKDTFLQWVDVCHEDWQFSGMSDVFQYLRGNRNLSIPEHWRGTIPNHLG